MITIEFCRDGEPVSDFDYLEWLDLVRNIQGPGLVFKVSTSIAIDVIRAEIFVDNIPHTEIRFLYRGEYIYPNKDAKLPVWPRGFCDLTTDVLSVLIGPKDKGLFDWAQINLHRRR